MLTANTARQLLDYDPETGVFIWKERPSLSATWNTRFAGKVAGRTVPNDQGYREVSIDGKLHYSHRLAWLWMTGAWPVNQIDHIDGDRLNNRFVNFREATAAQNTQNQRRQVKKSKTGFRGVYRQAGCATYFAALQVNKRRVYLGTFTTLDAAISAYRMAAREHHGEFAIPY